MKRSGQFEESERKRPVLGQVSQDCLNRQNTGLASPPVTPESHGAAKTVVLGHSELDKSRRRLFSEDGTRQQSVYALGKSFFMRGSGCDMLSDGKTLVGRQAECTKLQTFLETNLANCSSASMYISGPPGTGKTAQTMALLNWYMANGKQHGLRNIYDVNIRGAKVRTSIIKVNCMSILKPEDVYRVICGELQPKRVRYDSDTLARMLGDKSICDMNIVVLDELDNLVSKNQQVLFELFTWASHLKQRGTNLILVGIANALDLTDRFLPRLKNNKINPTVLPFLPYNDEQIKEVILHKFGKLSGGKSSCYDVPLFQSVAVTLCAKKVASNTSDIRKAMDIIHRSLDVIEETTRSKLGNEEFAKLTLETAPKVTIGLVAKVCNSIFGNQSGKANVKSFNFQHKLILIAIAKYEAALATAAPKRRGSAVTASGGSSTSPRKRGTGCSINGLYEFYTKEVQQSTMGALKRGEFMEILNSLEANGSISIGAKTNLDMGQCPVSCIISTRELADAVTDDPILHILLFNDQS